MSSEYLILFAGMVLQKHTFAEDQILFEETVAGTFMVTEKKAVEDGATDECMIYCVMWKPCQAILFHFNNYTDNINCELLQLDTG